MASEPALIYKEAIFNDTSRGATLKSFVIPMKSQPHSCLGPVYVMYFVKIMAI